MAVRAEEICMAPGTPKLISADGFKEIAQELKAYNAQDALDAVYQDAAKFLLCRKTAGHFENYLVQFELPRKVVEGRLGGGFHTVDGRSKVDALSWPGQVHTVDGRSIQWMALLSWPAPNVKLTFRIPGQWQPRDACAGVEEPAFSRAGWDES